MLDANQSAPAFSGLRLVVGPPVEIVACRPVSASERITRTSRAADDRLRTVKLLEQRAVFDLETVENGQVVEFTGDRPVETARWRPPATARCGSTRTPVRVRWTPGLTRRCEPSGNG